MADFQCARERWARQIVLNERSMMRKSHTATPKTSATPSEAWLAACGALVSLIFLALAWELVLAPIRPGGSWLVLKTLPLLAPLRGVLHARRYTFQWSSLFIWAYFAEGVVRAWSDRGASATL